MNKELKFSKEARNKIKEGADILANAVKVTLGPKGRNVVIEQEYKAPRITKDGVSVAKEIELEDHFVNIGAQLVKEVASKMGDSAGDGTTTATVLTQYILNEGFRILERNPDYSPVELKTGMDLAVKVIVEYIKNMSKDIKNDFDKIRQVATISANNDSNIGNLIAEAIENAGESGVVTIGESDSSATYITKVNGVQYKNRGYLDKFFITNADNDVCEYENTLLILFNGKLDKLDYIQNVLDEAYMHSKSVLIIANSFSEEVKQLLIMNKVSKGLKVCAINTPGKIDDKPTNLMDLAAITNSVVCSPTDSSFITPEEVNTVKKISINSMSATIIANNSNENAVKELVKEIKEQLKTESLNKEYLQERLARLDGGVSVINVGAMSDLELGEKKDRIEDALCAAKSAIEEGIVEGGGLTYLKIYNKLKEYSCDSMNEVKLEGFSLIRDSLTIPFEQICKNAGANPVGLFNLIADSNYTFGYDAKEGVLVNMFEKGIVDPAKVTRCALENAASVAGLFLTTECVITNKVEKFH